MLCGRGGEHDPWERENNASLPSPGCERKAGPITGSVSTFDQGLGRPLLGDRRSAPLSDPRAGGGASGRARAVSGRLRPWTARRRGCVGRGRPITGKVLSFRKGGEQL